MTLDINQIVTSAIEKSKKDLQFSEDLIKFVQYTALTESPKEKIGELKQILEAGNMKDLLEFCSRSVPIFEQKIVDYISKY